MGVTKEEMASSESPKRRTKAAIYQTVWRWHFYAGIIFSPFLMILAFSGGVYLFKPQIESVLYNDQYYVQEVGEKSLPYSTLVMNVQEGYPGGTIRFVKQYEEANRTVEIGLIEGEHLSSVFVDPYSGVIKGSINNEERFTEIFVKLHSELIVGGTAANYLVELASCWAIILLITGLYVWWPRNRTSIWGTILPRLRSKGKTFWRDMHAVPAFWLSIGILLLIMTGLPWSAMLGPQIQKVSVPPEYGYSYGEKPQSITYTKDVAVDIPWANETLSVPSSTVGEYVPLTVDEIHSIAKGSNIATPYAISMPVGKEGVYIISSSYIPNDLATLHVDQYSGAILSDVRFADFGLGAKLVEVGIAFHEGRLFGLANQLLGLVICVGLIFVIFSSYVMWRKRKPDTKFGAPSKSKDKKVTRTVFFIMLGLGVLLPLVGISIIVIWVLDRFVLSKIKRLHTWFN